MMTMDCDGVLHRRVYKLFLGVGRNRDSAVFLARIISAIYKHSGHWGLPRHNCFSLHPFTRGRNVIVVGDSYSDLGATITAPQPDLNLAFI
jgi:hypothetical protein